MPMRATAAQSFTRLLKAADVMAPGKVKTERFSRTEWKTPAFVEGEVQKLLDAVDASTHTGLRDRALLGLLS
jgi:site-specific recombinase XerD